MATVTHYIYSRYDPKDRERLRQETGQTEVEVPEEHEDPWQTESSFGAQRRLAAAPRFIPAVVPYDELNNMIGAFPQATIPSTGAEVDASNAVGGWYRSLTRQSSSDITPRPSTAPLPSMQNPSESLIYSPKAVMPRRDKNNWFISRALQSEPPSAPATPPPTLADILARDPPPSSSNKPFKPPVFLALGPSNKGWAMLQQHGWSEGEGIGATVARRADARSVPANSRRKKTRRETDRVVVKQEEREVRWDAEGEISELCKVEVVDLTLSDSSDSDDDEVDEPEPFSLSTAIESPPSHTTPLLTPISTTLKSDRLGIGLKAKTVGLHRASKKRITHNQAALAANIRASEEMRRMKAITGRGSRGFARLAKADEERRKQLLANLNTG